MNNQNKKILFNKIADRVRNDSYFLAQVLSKYEILHDISDQQLATYLECKPDGLIRLFLCRLPNVDDRQFQKDIRRIAEFAKCNLDKLVKILREVTAIIALQDETANISSRGLLMAARDRHKEHKGREKDVPLDSEKDKNGR